MMRHLGLIALLGVSAIACTLDGENQDPNAFMSGNADSQEADTSSEESGDSGESSEPGDGDGDPGDGDGDPGDGDGDGDPGDGDGDPGDGDGDPGDGDGDPGPICGNGLIEAPEECDGNNLGGATCVDEGFVGGPLTCAPGCSFDTSACIDDNEGEGTPCTFDNDCPNDFACVDNQCYDGSEGDPCVFDSDCAADNHCADDQCWDGGVGDPCISDNDCMSDICLISEKFCSEGNPGDPCTFNSECINSCSNDVCT